MKKRFGAAGVCTALLALIGSPAPATAEVNVNINLGPPVVVAEPPAVALIPGFGVYFVPGVEVDLFFYGGYWWSPRGDRWYRARGYNGPWVVVGRRAVPAQVIRVPRDYRGRYKKAKHVPYGQWKKRHEVREHRRDHRRDHRDEHRKGKGHGRRD